MWGKRKPQSILRYCCVSGLAKYSVLEHTSLSLTSRVRLNRLVFGRSQGKTVTLGMCIGLNVLVLGVGRVACTPCSKGYI